MCGMDTKISEKLNTNIDELKQKYPYSDVIKFHGHVCPGVTLGYCAALLAIQELSVDRDVNEQLVTIVENDACGVDAIQVVTGCTIGKGNLIFHDHGKHVYTFINRATNDAVRISLKDRTGSESDDLKKLREKMRKNEASETEKSLARQKMQEHVDRMLAEPFENNFTVSRVKGDIPEKARLFNSVRCSRCGEMVAESRARVQNGGIVCIPCFDEYSRGW